MYKHLHTTSIMPAGNIAASLMKLATIILLSAVIAISVQASPQDPMEDQHSLSIRSDYAECREQNNPMSQFFCNCRVLEKQCEAPRKLQHGDWNTVEFWPSDDPSEREVQFILFLSYDILGDLAPVDTGIVMTCVNGVSELNAFVGNDIDPAIKPKVEIDNVAYESEFSKSDDDYVLGFIQNKQVYEAMRKSQRLTVSFHDSAGTLKDLEFDTIGFDEVTKGWEKLCSSLES